MNSIVPLFALVAPLFIWPIEQVLPFPFIVEEIAKAIIIYFIAISDEKRSLKIKQTILVGVLFALTESVLYLFNIYAFGSLETLLLRLVVTIPLHVITSLLILFPTLKSKWLIVIGVILASLFHLFYNASVSLIFPFGSQLPF
jgi:RsiW-degrading membrane proteinase PrsW (M82 family)